MPEFERPPQPVSTNVPRPKYEQKPAADAFPMQKQEAPETKAEGALGRIIKSTAMFLQDVARANTLATDSLKETALSRVGKGIAVTTSGVVLEMLSEATLELAIGTLGSQIKGKGAKGIAEFINKPWVREMLEDTAAFGVYSAGNKLLDNVLPKIPVSSLGFALGVNAAQGAMGGKFGIPKKILMSSVYVDGNDGSLKIKQNNEEAKIKTAAEQDKTKGDSTNTQSEKESLLGRLINNSNPVTIFGVGQIYDGVSAYWKGLQKIRKTRATSGEQGVQRLLVGVGKAQ